MSTEATIVCTILGVLFLVAFWRQIIALLFIGGLIFAGVVMLASRQGAEGEESSEIVNVAPITATTSDVLYTGGTYGVAAERLGVAKVNPEGVWTYEQKTGEDEALLTEIHVSGEINFLATGDYVETQTTKLVPKGLGQAERSLTITLRGKWAAGEDGQAIGCRIDTATVDKFSGIPSSQASSAADKFIGPMPLVVDASFSEDSLWVTVRGQRLSLDRKTDAERERETIQ